MSMAAVLMATTASLGIFSCEASGDKQRNGAIIGAIIGGVIGNRVSDDNKTVGTVVGAAVGGAAGSYIGCQLQKRDRDRLAADSQRALALGEGATWTSADSGVQAATSVASTRSTSSSSIALAPRVTQPSSLILMGGRYAVTRDVVLKAAPNSTSRTVGGVGVGDDVDVLGRTGGSAPWAAIEEGGVVIGYVPMTALRSLGTVSNTVEAAPVTSRRVSIPTTKVCRVVTQTITPPDGGTPQTRNVEACVEPDGSWRTAT